MVFLFLLVFLCTGFTPSAPAQTVRELRFTLKEALQVIDTTNLQVVMANARVEGAIARLSESRSDLLPHIEGDVNAGRESADMRDEGILFPGIGPHIGPFNTFDARGKVTMALFDLSALERLRAAQKGRELSHAELEKTREDVLALTANLFIDAQRKQQTAVLYKKLLDRDQMAFDLSESSLGQGTGAALDAQRAKVTLDGTRYFYREAQYLYQEAVLDFDAALQISPRDSVSFEDDRDFEKALEKASDASFTDAPNADVAAASSQLASSQADKKTAIADFLPKVSGSADYGRSGGSPSEGSNTYFVGIQATVPVWEGGENQAKLKETQAQVKEDEANLKDAARQEEVNIAKARASIAEAADLLESKIQQKETAQSALLVALQAQETGSGSVFEVMKSKADLASAEDDYNEAQATWIMAHINLLHAEGKLRSLIK